MSPMTFPPVSLQRAHFNLPTLSSSSKPYIVEVLTFLIVLVFAASASSAATVRVSVSPGKASVESAEAEQFSATVSGGGDSAVKWSTTQGKVSSGGLFTAPAVKTDITVSVTATSIADPTKSATAEVTVTPPVAVSITPTSATVNSLDNQSFKATVTNTNKLGVTWSASLGTISSSGVFTAPSVKTGTTVSVTATSVADPTKSASAEVTVNPPVSVAVTPTSASVSSSATQQLTATVSNTGDTGVTWKVSAGQVSSGGLFTAPDVHSTTTSVVTATSQADRTKSSTATITVMPLATLAITTSSLPAAVAGTQYSTTLAATGGTPPYSWSVSSQWGSLPSGIALSDNGVLSGTTQDTGAFTAYINVTDSARYPQKGTATLVLTVNLNTAGNSVPATMFNIHINRANTPWPSSPVAGQRFWDTGVTWGLINTGLGVYDWTLLDQRLAEAQANNADVLYDLSMTPVWAQCGPGTSSPCHQTPGCAYDNTSYGGGNGQCYWPADLNSDGTGTDQYWKDWVTAVATHSVNSASGHIKYYEIWNEPNETGFWRGTTAQLVRLAQDAACIIKGTGTGCTNTAIDPDALMVTPAPTLGGDAINTWMLGYMAGGGAQYSDVIGFHGYNMTDAEKIVTLASTLRDGALTTYNQLSKPMFDTEFSWGEGVSFPDPNEQAGFVGRSMLLHWSSGVSRVYWYAWDLSGIMWTPTSTVGCTTTNPGGDGFICETGTAFTQVQSWMVGATLTQACTEAGTVYTCEFTKPGGYQALAVWDTSQSCSNGKCTTSTFTFPPVKPNYLHYLNLAGTSTNISGPTVPIGYEPILLENQ